MEQTLKFGSLYLDDIPANIGAEYQAGQTISFGSATLNKVISWVPVNGRLIADQCLLTGISWDDLDAQGLVFGKEIKIHDFKFQVRLLKVGNAQGVSNEWDASLDTVGSDDSLWHWSGVFFWGQDTANIDATNRMCRGYSSVHCSTWFSSANQSSGLGFRPLLEPLPADPFALRHGQEVLIIGNDGAVMGNLMDTTPYDLILQTKLAGLVGRTSFATNMRNGIVAVDRSGILSIASA